MLHLKVYANSVNVLCRFSFFQFYRIVTALIVMNNNVRSRREHARTPMPRSLMSSMFVTVYIVS